MSLAQPKRPKLSRELVDALLPPAPPMAPPSRPPVQHVIINVEPGASLTLFLGQPELQHAGSAASKTRLKRGR
ncbi:MAG: hypothetical protein K2X46_08605 [Roseomonas sp.]|nr:hypothetical protein [Roseomonas sp.]